MNAFFRASCALFAAMVIAPAFAGVDESVAKLQTEWEQIKYRQPADKQEKAYEALTKDAAAVRAEHPDRSEADIWYAIVVASHAGAKGGLGALGLAKAAKKSLDQAISINGQALDGSAYTSLGTLYAKVPGWPVGFGDERKAETLLLKALQINPNGIDPNYFYADFLREQGDTAKARQYLLRARKAAPRPGRELADQGRQGEITAALKALDGR